MFAYRERVNPEEEKRMINFNFLLRQHMIYYLYYADFAEFWKKNTITRLMNHRPRMIIVKIQGHLLAFQRQVHSNLLYSVAFGKSKPKIIYGPAANHAFAL